MAVITIEMINNNYPLTFYGVDYYGVKQEGRFIFIRTVSAIEYINAKYIKRITVKDDSDYYKEMKDSMIRI